jgi:hypothetical protein
MNTLATEIRNAVARSISIREDSLIGKSYDFAVYRVVQGFFPGGIHLKMRIGAADGQLGALFRFINRRIYCILTCW